MVSLGNYIIGYADLAQVLGVTVKTIDNQKYNKRFTLQPVAKRGRLLIFDRKEAEAYRPVFLAQLGKRKPRAKAAHNG